MDQRRIELRIEACKATVIPFNYKPILAFIEKLYSFFVGPCSRIRTCDPLVPNEMRYQAALYTGKWCPRGDSNSQNLVSKTSTYTIPSPGQLFLKTLLLILSKIMVEPVGFEPTVFLMWQIYSLLPSTNSAHVSI